MLFRGLSDKCIRSAISLMVDRSQKCPAEAQQAFCDLLSCTLTRVKSFDAHIIHRLNYYSGIEILRILLRRGKLAPLTGEELLCACKLWYQIVFTRKAYPFK